MEDHNPDTVGWLSNPDNAVKELNQALIHFGKDDFLFTLHNIAIAQGVAQLAKKTGLTREGLYKILQPSGNPKLSVLIDIMRAMGFELQLIPKPSFVEEKQIFRAIRINSLAQTFPIVAAHWHSDKNGTLTANDITPNSRKKIWWNCFDVNNKIKHEWEATPISLIKEIKTNLFKGCDFSEEAFAKQLKRTCPYCSGKYFPEQ